MGEREAFVRSICDVPEDDTRRLVFADWLDEHGAGDRAEFVRVQVELEREYESVRCRAAVASQQSIIGGGTKCDCHPCGLARREGELWGDADRGLGRRMLAELPGPLSEQGWSVALRDCFRRGFVEAVTCSAADFLAHAADLLSRHPISTVTLTTMPEIDPGDWYLTPNAAIVSLRGHARTCLADRTDTREVIVWRLLSAEWPRVKFHLPEPARSSGSASEPPS